jgi:5'-3' exonuclease
LNLPVIYRCDEKYICPQEEGWEARYYKRMLDMKPSKENIEKVCLNYLEGLEWVYHYYTGECQDWRWKYSYTYPPLLADLSKYIPIGPKKMFSQTPDLKLYRV